MLSAGVEFGFKMQQQLWKAVPSYFILDSIRGLALDGKGRSTPESPLAIFNTASMPDPYKAFTRMGAIEHENRSRTLVYFIGLAASWTTASLPANCDCKG